MRGRCTGRLAAASLIVKGVFVSVKTLYCRVAMPWTFS